MSEASPLSPELSHGVSALARSLVAAARSWTLYAREHPAVQTSVERPAVEAVDPDAVRLDPLTYM